MTAVLLGAAAALAAATSSRPRGRVTRLRRPLPSRAGRRRGASARRVARAAPAARAPRVVDRRRRRARAPPAPAAVREALPEVVDLLASPARPACPARGPPAVARTAASGRPALRPPTRRHRGRPRRRPRRRTWRRSGDRAHALAQVLVDHLRYGVPLLPALERTGLELRLDRRRAAEQEARRVPVRLLGPARPLRAPRLRPAHRRPPPRRVPRGAAHLTDIRPSEVIPCSGPSCPSRCSPSPPPTGSAGALADDRGQSTAEYALVLLGAAGVALLLVAWATKTDKVTRLLNSVIDRVLDQVS